MTRSDIDQLITNAAQGINRVLCEPELETPEEVQLAYLASIASSLLAIAGLMFESGKK